MFWEDHLWWWQISSGDNCTMESYRKTPFKLEERRWKRKYDLIRSMEGTCQVTALGLSLIPHPFQRCPFFLTRRCWFVHHTAKNIAIFPKVLYKNVDGQRSYLVFHIGRCPTEKHNKRWHLGEEMSSVSFCLQWRSVKLDAHSELVSSAKTDSLNNKARTCVSR